MMPSVFALAFAAVSFALYLRERELRVKYQEAAEELARSVARLRDDQT